MAKKEKIRKKTEDEIRIIECIKDYLNKYSAKSNLVRNIEFKEETDDNALRFIASIDYGAFEQRITYYPFMWMRQHLIDVDFSFEKTDYAYTFYDIFNLFNITDFNLYYYDTLISNDDVKKALDDILSATEKYFEYLEKAQTEEYISTLEKNYETDMNTALGGDDWKEDEELDDIILLPFTHPFYSVSDGQITSKTLKKLQKKNAKGKLDTIYEKRLLEYLEGGNKFERKTFTDITDFEKLYKKTKIKVYVLLFAVSVVLSFLLSLGLHAVIFNGATTFGSYLEIFGITVTLPISGIGVSLLGAIFLMIMLIPIVGRKLVILFVPQEHKNRADAKFDKEYNGDSSKKVKKAMGAFVVVFFFVMFALSILLSVSDIGYYDTSVKFIDDSLRFCSIPYEEIEIGKLQGYYNSGEFIPYENAYIIFSGDKSYELGELTPDGLTQQKLEEIAEKYNKEIKEIRTTEDLYENSGN
ncbi:MAG: hypothetical protein J1E05_00905 [Eubacterium sp.]|nr:hypothetical protein [Eubacterium sp.]